MQIHEIQREHKNSTKKRVGRGGKRGDYSGRGMKGQGQHASSAPRPEMRDIIKKIPKKRGYRFNSFRPDFYVVNVSTLSEVFNDGDTVTPKILITKKVMRIKKGTRPRVKILGNGEITKKLIIQKCVLSGSAQEKIKKAGGTITLLVATTEKKKKKETKGPSTLKTMNTVSKASIKTINGVALKKIKTVNTVAVKTKETKSKK